MKIRAAKRLNRRDLVKQLRQGFTIESIAQERGLAVVRVCKALEHFQICVNKPS
ncbi:MAG: hypothetical protein P8M22_10360 [Phycisphaerales bacterium]|nr:hypothetical protein [Phycisphaerales bacterium]